MIPSQPDLRIFLQSRASQAKELYHLTDSVAVEFRQAMAHGFLVTQGHMFCEGLHEGAVQMIGVFAATPDTHGGLSLLDSSVEALLLLEGMYEFGLELLSEDARLT